jgi:hypothetical protein
VTAAVPVRHALPQTWSALLKKAARPAVTARRGRASSTHGDAVTAPSHTDLSHTDPSHTDSGHAGSRPQGKPGRPWWVLLTLCLLFLGTLLALALMTHTPLILIAEALAVVLFGISALLKEW